MQGKNFPRMPFHQPRIEKIEVKKEYKNPFYLCLFINYKGLYLSDVNDRGQWKLVKNFDKKVIKIMDIKCDFV